MRGTLPESMACDTEMTASVAALLAPAVPTLDGPLVSADTPGKSDADPSRSAL